MEEMTKVQPGQQMLLEAMSKYWKIYSFTVEQIEEDNSMAVYEVERSKLNSSNLFLQAENSAMELENKGIMNSPKMESNKRRLFGDTTTGAGGEATQSTTVEAIPILGETDEENTTFGDRELGGGLPLCRSSGRTDNGDDGNKIVERCGNSPEQCGNLPYIHGISSTPGGGSSDPWETYYKE